MPSVSIIIPVYNAAETLDKCVSSVLAQSFNDWELLLVDDGSVDDSLAICARHCKSDSRINLLTKEHGGASSARNLALGKIQGQYVCFIDADDSVATTYLESLFQCKDYEMVICGYSVDYYGERGDFIRQEIFCPTNLVLSPIYDRTQLIPLFKSGMIHINCNKLLHADIIQKYDICFPAIPVNEDYLFMLEYLEHCQSIKTIQTPLYHWRRVKGIEYSLSSFSFDQVNVYNEAHLLTTRFFNDRKVAGQILYYSYYWQVLKYLEHIENGDAHFHDLAHLMQNELLKEAFFFYEPSSQGERILLFLLKNKFYHLFYLFNKILQKDRFER